MTKIGGIVIVLAIVILTCASAWCSTIELPQTGQTKCYDSQGTEIFCVGDTGQDGDIRAGVPWPDPRFGNNGDGTVTDKLTGLIWTEDANAPGPSACIHGVSMSWEGALDYAKCLNANNYLGHNDWRLPNVNEISSFMHAGQENISAWLNTSGFFNVQEGYYWSSTPQESPSGMSLGAWVFGMIEGDLDIYGGNFAWPVRGGMPCTSATVCLPQTYRTTCYEEQDGEPTPINCTGTGQDGEIRAGVPWPNPRFAVNADGSTTDNLTDIIWGPSQGHKMWQGALSHIKNLNASNYLGHSDWRLPSILELRSNYSYHSANVPPWTCDSLAAGPSNAWVFRRPRPKGNSRLVIPIRGGQLVSFSAVDVSPSSFDFGSAIVGSAGTVAQQFDVSNTSLADLVLGTLSLVGNAPLHFVTSNDFCSGQTLTPSGHCTVEVFFKPTSQGIKEAYLAIPSNDQAKPNVYVPLSGKGVVLSAPSGLKVKSISASRIVLSWKDNSGNETGFKIERKLGSCSAATNWIQVATRGANVSTYTDKKLNPLTDYSDRVRAYNAIGDSSASNCASAKTGTSGTPPAPTELKAVSVSTSQINLTWKDNSAGEKSFRIYRKTGTDSWSLLSTTAANTVNYKDLHAGGNKAKTGYSYYVKACNNNGCSPATNTAVVPFAPVTLSALSHGYGQINLTWADKSVNETGFEIYRKAGYCSSTNPWGILTDSIAANTETFQNTGLSAGKTYAYKVRAYFQSISQPYAYGYSPYTNCDEATTH